MTRAVDVQLSEDHNVALKKRVDEFAAKGVEATKSAFYHDGEQAELVC
jgi:hypothetical protein